jgi:hypothetical protein
MQREQYGRPGRHSGDGSAPTPIDGYDQAGPQPSHRSDSYSQPQRSDSEPPRAQVRWRLGIGIALVIVIILCAGAALSKQFRHQIEISVVRQGTPYSQLYFASPTKLPTQLKVNKSNIFDFTIENDEGRAYRYTYTVTLEDSRSHVVLSKETVEISNGDGATRRIAVTPKDRKSRYLITVSLEGMNQSIHFYAETS